MALCNPSFVPEFPGLGAGCGIPPRTALFALPPIGVGTPAAEGLISYIVRLAEAYSISPRRLIRDELSKVCPEIGRFRRGPFFERDARTVNGLHRYSRWFSGAIGQLCGIAAEDLTLIPLAGLLPKNGAGLISAAPRWCPTCYAEMLASGKPISQPLVWSFDLYRLCPRHRCSMAECCSHCGMRQYPVPRSPCLGYCCHCGQWLGRPLEQKASCDPLEFWAATSIEEIVAKLPQLAGLATRARFMQQLCKAVDGFADGNRARFCREIGLPEFALKNWLSRNENPTLPQWLNISYALNISPIGFLSVNFEVDTTPCIRKLPGQLKSRTKPPHLSSELSKVLQNDLDAIAASAEGKVSIAMLTEKYGLKRSYLKYRWPEQCRRISLDYRRINKIRTSGRIAERCINTQHTVDRLLNEGVFPSIRTVRDNLRTQGIHLAHPAIRNAYRLRLKELFDGKE